MRELWPEVYRQFEEIADRLEQTYKDVQDLEFTVERGKLYMLQTRNAKRTGKAAVVTAVEMVGEGLITRDEALKRIQPMHVQQILVPQFDPASTKQGRRRRSAAGSPLRLAPRSARSSSIPIVRPSWPRNGEPVILTRKETSPEDFHGMAPAVGILTSRGGSS